MDEVLNKITHNKHIRCSINGFDYSFTTCPLSHEGKSGRRTRASQSHLMFLVQVIGDGTVNFPHGTSCSALCKQLSILGNMQFHVSNDDRK